MTMRSFSGADAVIVHVIQLAPGDYVLESLREFLAEKDIKNGAVISGIGTLDQCTMHMVTTAGLPPVEVYPHWEDVGLELVSMQGVIADGIPHIHMTVSTFTGAVGGHLEEKCRILYLGEIVLLEFPGLDLTRVPNQSNIMTLTSRVAPLP